MRKQTLKGLAVGLVAVFALAACGGSDTASDTTAAVVDTTPAEPAGLACEVTDTGGVDDKGFNQIAYEGLLQAADSLGVTTEVLESVSDADYAPNLQSFVDATGVGDFTGKTCWFGWGGIYYCCSCV